MTTVNPEHYTEGDCKLAAGIALHGQLPERFELRLEVRLQAGPGSLRRGARLDMAIVERESGRIVLVVEVKRSPGSSASAQGERYGRLAGAPVLYLRGLKACRACAAVVLERLAGIA